MVHLIVKPLLQRKFLIRNLIRCKNIICAHAEDLFPVVRVWVRCLQALGLFFKELIKAHTDLQDKGARSLYSKAMEQIRKEYIVKNSSGSRERRCSRVLIVVWGFHLWSSREDVWLLGDMVCGGVFLF